MKKYKLQNFKKEGSSIMDKYLTNDNVDTLFIRKRNKENKDRQVE